MFSRKSSVLDALSGQDAVLRTTGRTTPVTVTAVDGKKIVLAYPKGPIADQAILTCAHADAGLITARGKTDKQGVLVVKEFDCVAQRRAAYRVKVACEVEVGLTRGDTIPARTTDLSVTGLRLASCPRLRVDDEIRVRLMLGDAVLKARARVVRADRGGGCGVRFLDLQAGEDQLLGSFVADLQRNNVSALAR